MAGRIWRALTSNVAATQDGHEDARLRGRTYAIPYEDVWTAAHALAAGGLRRWRVVAADDEEGVIEAESTTLVRRRVDDVVIRISLDADAQTRVDARSSVRRGYADGGRNARRLNRFFRALDRAVVDAQRRRREARAGAAAAAGTLPATAGSGAAPASGTSSPAGAAGGTA
jgi:uncharacterized protein (DUF1499 family)